ncbi:hypothetical protein ACWGDX_33170 [Streptomyces sp. NPDC055025]
MVMGTDAQSPIGRPRGFDTERTPERAVLVFSRHGYEGARPAGLTDAVGIGRTSTYAPYGSKRRPRIA